MTHLKNSFVKASRKNRRTIAVVAFCLFAMTLPPRSKAQSRTRGAHTVRESERVSAVGPQDAQGPNAGRDTLLQALSKAPESASLLNALGSLQQDTGEYLEAERSYLHALSTAATSNDSERVVVLQNLGALYLETNQYSKGERIRRQLEKLQPGIFADHPAAAGVLLNIIASLEHARKRDDEAEHYYSESLNFLHQAHGPVSVDAALVEANLGFLRLESRQYDSAASFFRQAIHEIEIADGPKSAALIRPLVNLARCENMIGQPNEAEALSRRGVELSLQTFGETHPVTATAMLEQAASLRNLQRKKLARGLERRAKAMLRDNSTKNLAGYTVGLRDLGN
ncbi:MAG: tetratricopeptide repeat protein [Acidobacteriaceae bacterium]|nr:tetratricopeptide repeat protein [Acidobacteriaceae bacterium]